MSGFEFQQQQSQSQIQALSQRQIQSLQMLSMGSDDLRNEIYKAVEENPALEITKDTIETSGSKISVYKSKIQNNFTHTTSKTSASALEASDSFQAALEAKADERISLQEHLLQQLNMLNISQVQKKLGEKLIGNLDDRGFNLSSPVSLLDKKNPLETEELLEQTLNLIQQFDPTGTCTDNSEKSLFVQAKNNPLCPPQALFILDGHLNFIDPPQSTKAAKKINSFFKEQLKLFGLPQKIINYSKLDFSEECIQKAIDFIKTLDPFPAHNFGSNSTHYICPDIYVEKIKATEYLELESDQIIKAGKNYYKIKTSTSLLPKVCINRDYEKIAEQIQESSNKISAEEKQKIKDSIKNAQNFIDTLNYRQNTILKACTEILKHQSDFFEKGPGNLKALRQIDIAEKIGVHETTVSRMANSKYIQCEWGLFPVKYFFTNAVDSSNLTSKDKIIFEIKKILEENSDKEKNLSDQKISDLLSQKGIQVARRTVAKYRSQLNINSSYKR